MNRSTLPLSATETGPSGAELHERSPLTPTLSPFGERETAPEFPLVLLHGLLGSSADWALPAAEWSKTRRVRAIDLRGHGQSPAATSPLTLDDLAADVAADILAHCREQTASAAGSTRESGVVLVGASLGGVVALRVAARLGHRVRALVLAATDPCPETDGSRARRRATLDLADRLGARSVFRALAPSMFGRTTRRDRPVLISRWLAGVLEIDPESVRPVVEAALSRDDLRPLLPEIRCPVLVLAGDEDEITSVGASDALTHGLPSSRRVIVREAGHSLHLEQPLRVANLVSELLREPM